MSSRCTLLGSGTSSGVPEIGCPCRVCRSDDERDSRMRAGLRLDLPEGIVLVDTPTDLRQQALRFEIPRVDAVLWTHFHADHVFGIDELRAFNRLQEGAIEGFGSKATLADIRRSFAYVFEGKKGRPSLTLNEIEGPFELLGVLIRPVQLWHRDLEVLGFRIGDLAYCTDCNFIPESSYEQLEGLETLILDGLRLSPHPTHFSIPEAIEVADRIGAEKTYLTHLSHEVHHETVSAGLPDGVELAYDGLVIDF